MITIVDYGMGNIGSIQNMLKYIGIESIATNSVVEVKKASKLILPGVGSFDTAVQKIKDSGLYDVLNEKAMIEKVPILGICLGMQLLTRGSEEGALGGFGWIQADTIGFKNLSGFAHRVPHMGWNYVRKTQNSVLTEGLEVFEKPKFYFVHSYFVRTDCDEHSILKTSYGFEFDSAVQKDNIYGVQFHPEKSHKYGLKLLENFARHCG